MVDHRRSLHEEMMADARSRFPIILRTEVPYWSEIERMTLRRAPLPAFAPHSPAAQMYKALWREIGTKLRSR
jgi:cellulose biosynthesis protein BcsQ